MAGTSHPLFARVYERLSVAMDRAGVAEHRRALVAGLRGRVVEVGCGNGRMFAHYPPEVTEVVAVEPEPRLRAAAEVAAGSAPVPVRVIDGVAEALPLGDEEFDAAVVSLVLCSVHDQAAALAEAARVLRPGGSLRFFEHVVAERPGALRRVQRLVDATIWPRLFGGCHSGRDTLAAIAAAGFTVDDVHRFRFPPSGPGSPSSHHVRGSATLAGRAPTSHERMTGQPWDASYADGPAPWDVGRPQREVVRLADEGRFAGTVLDAGCGTGENALYVAARGLPVLGVDVAESALAMARRKAEERGIAAEFAVADALHLERLGRTFGTVLDCGLFHTFDGDERLRYVAGLAAVTEAGGTLHLVCFSDEGPATGPHPVSREDLRAAFTAGRGWRITSLEPGRVETRFHDDGAPAWIATIARV
ncbi:methyltransferase domain-containing protein [Actinoplanes sp. NPDC049548]|uniref:class I SAM-dependent methyltransferase n=1 Tax=Actinoplanes sp. NPDC049548 TaxID=3155152 RepID=UPI003439F634